ncbi:hypothetical protein PMY35_13880 [Clostridium tertium]|uniref:IS1/IS1595 family N-terminal zinc-binding domain-containing protein n=1 Tax=Clostridium tertium TaxID=1559 RepID=UPI00232CAD54|nr:hypothetical protein [Clostridium tertium]MDB1948917.1 hypothetical protein [Clostridium tertium]
MEIPSTLYSYGYNSNSNITINYYCDEINNEINNKFKQVELYLNELSIIDFLKDKKIKACPNCNSNNFIKYGKYRGLQRFKCLNKDCCKTFSQKTNSIFSNSKKPLELWLKYLILMNNKFSLRKCSSVLGINLATSFYWRHKFLVTQMSNNYNVLKNYIEVSKIIIKENFKGDKKARYYNKENIFIACAMDSNKSLISKAISRRSISLVAINKNFSQNIDKSSIISAYNDRYFDIYAKNHNNTIFPLSSQVISKVINQLYSNNLTNSNILSLKNINETLPSNSIFIHKFSLNIKRWLVRFKGVATKYLENYLNWHILDFKNDYKIYSSNQLLLFKSLSLKSTYIKIKNFPKYKLIYQYTSNGNY